MAASERAELTRLRRENALDDVTVLCRLLSQQVRLLRLAVPADLGPGAGG